MFITKKLIEKVINIKKVTELLKKVIEIQKVTKMMKLQLKRWNQLNKMTKKVTQLFSLLFFTHHQASLSQFTDKIPIKMSSIFKLIHHQCNLPI